MRFDAARAGLLDSRSTVAIAYHDRDFGIGNAAGGDAIGQRFEIRSAARKQHANAFFHDRPKLA